MQPLTETQASCNDSLRFNAIGKHFPGVQALANISFVAYPG